LHSFSRADVTGNVEGIRLERASGAQEMKSSLTPINLALDAVAFLVMVFGWAFLVGLPVFAVFEVVHLADPGESVTGLLQDFMQLLIFGLGVGLSLKWIAGGIIERKRIRMGFSVLIFGFLASRFLLIFASLLLTKQIDMYDLGWLENGIVCLFVAVMVVVGLTKGAKSLNAP
jgi:hypothetical protein